MAIPSGLFIDNPETPDATLHHLSEDMDAWPEEIIQKFKERVPDSQGLNMFVKFMKKDEENGTSTGSITVSSSNRQATIPLIVKDFMLNPLDVFFVEKKMLPLTPDYFKKAFSDNNVFKSLEEYPTFGGLGRFEDANLWNAVYPPSLGRYAYASAGYPVLDAISDSIDGSEFKMFLNDNPTIAANFYKKGQAEIIKKVANLRPVNMNEFRQGVDSLINRPVAMLRRDGPNAYSILSNSDNIWSPALTEVDRPELCKMVSEVSDHVQDIVNDVDQNGERLLEVPSQVNDGQVYVEGLGGDTEVVESCDEFDEYIVKSRTGVIHKGYVIPKVIDFNQEPVDLKVFLGKTMSTIQPEIAGSKETESYKKDRTNLDRMERILHGQKPRIGQTGVFVYQPNESKALCTIPVTIKSVSGEHGMLKMQVMDLMGRGYGLRVGGADLQRIALCEGMYHIPKSFKWVPMEGFTQVSANAADFHLMKNAQVKTANPVKVIPTGYGQYSVKGVTKYARERGWDETNLNRHQVIFTLASLGMGSEKISDSIKLASKKGQVIIHGLKFNPLQSEKVAQAIPLAMRMKKVADGFKCNLIKQAGYLDNSQSVDALLSLNFINPENISKFVSRIPAFKACISYLASCLVASRLGVEEIPQHETSTAMFKLIDVVNGLEALRSQQEGAANSP